MVVIFVGDGGGFNVCYLACNLYAEYFTTWLLLAFKDLLTGNTFLIFNSSYFWVLLYDNKMALNIKH